MKTLEIQLPDDVATRAEKVAHEQGIALDELVRVSVEEKLERDEQFEHAAEYVLDKNAELYERLS